MLRDLELPVTVADGLVTARPPEQGALDRRGVIDGEGQDVDAIDHSALGQGCAGCGGQCRQDVDEVNRLRNPLASGNLRRPADEEWRPDSAFEEGPFPAAVRLVDVVEPCV